MKQVIFAMLLTGAIATVIDANAQGRGHGHGHGKAKGYKHGYRGNNRQVTVIHTLPPSARVYHYQGIDYHYASGRYYRQGPSGYTIVTALPLGIEVNIIPSGYRRRVYHGVPYYYSGNTYYRESRPDVFVVVGRPW